MSRFMDSEKQKIFRDPVHGYISIPSAFCRAFIDTPIFQRLRSIEQTSMRCLYPSARHDRFAHSIGVYHLASIAFHHVVKNTKEKHSKKFDIEQYKNEFLIAALMHDCAHSPFSHTLEDYYNIGDNAKKYFFSLVNHEFKEDYNSSFDAGRGGAAPHEIFSAAILLDLYEGKIKSEFKRIDIVLIARMITGCVHQMPNTLKKQVENCLIQLINGPIDVDKLDYIVRDTWASGVNNVSIDIHRLLSSLELYPDGTDVLKPAFRKSALSVIQSVIDGRNFLYQWIYSHHIVVYFNQLLQNAFSALNKVFSSQLKPDQFAISVFGKEAFINNQKVSCKHKTANIYLPNDSDINYLFKKFKDEIPEAEELLSRHPKLIPLWKSQVEFDEIFKAYSSPQRANLRIQSKTILKCVLKKAADSIRIIEVKPKYTTIESNEVYIILPQEILLSYDKTELNVSSKKDSHPFFYVYIPRQAKNQDKIILNCFEAFKKAKVA